MSTLRSEFIAMKVVVEQIEGYGINYACLESQLTAQQMSIATMKWSSKTQQYWIQQSRKSRP